MTARRPRPRGRSGELKESSNKFVKSRPRFSIVESGSFAGNKRCVRLILRIIGIDRTKRSEKVDKGAKFVKAESQTKQGLVLVVNKL